MFERNFAISAKGIIVLLGVVGSINVLIYATALSPGFSTPSNVFRGIDNS